MRNTTGSTATCLYCTKTGVRYEIIFNTKATIVNLCHDHNEPIETIIEDAREYRDQRFATKGQSEYLDEKYQPMRLEDLI